ncbi:MAG TPA: molybdopterin-dependent oxidoreductase [Pirellulaceae bacterium]|jgi:hypothetical protein|nr:molybdopterin-dependent oxidoreductase [Pirellulaceae bacterium]
MTTDPDLPPRQRLAAVGKWPLVGERERLPSDEPWRLTLAIENREVGIWTLDGLRRLGAETRSVDFHCVTRWSRTDVRVTGIRLERLLAEAGLSSPTGFVSWVARTARRHSSSLPLAEALRLGAMLAWEVDGQPLTPEHGGPLRSVVPGKYFFKSVKWVERIDLLANDRMGYWEAEAGYHNGADPWQEERYVAGGLSREQLRGLLTTRDWSGREVLSLVAEGRDLAGLIARRALLRNANFRGANLAGADFEGANVSNACFAGASLRGAGFQNADVEGAEFEGTDLSGADFRGASLFGATFTGATINRGTRFDARQLEALAEAERAFLAEALQRAGVPDDEAKKDRPSD